MKKMISSLALFTSILSVVTILQYDKLSNFGAEWQSGMVMRIYTKRALSDAKMRAEARGGVRSCMALRNAGGIRECKTFGVSLSDRAIDAPAGVGAMSF